MSKNKSSWVDGLTILLRKLQYANQEGTAGQIVVASPSEDVIVGTLTLFALQETDPRRAKSRMNIFEPELRSKGISYTFSARSVAKLTSTYRQVPDINTGDNGVAGGTVAISNTLFNSTNGPEHIARILAHLPLGRGDLLFTCNLGGETMGDDVANTAMHPGWRASSQLINFVQEIKPSPGNRKHVLDQLTEIYMPLLYSIDSGFRLSYLNVGDPNEKDFQQVYWGSNYERLLAIKQRWDPDDLFITHLGVGSENWDREGMCRKRRSVIDHAFDWTSYLWWSMLYMVKA